MHCAHMPALIVVIQHTIYMFFLSSGEGSTIIGSIHNVVNLYRLYTFAVYHSVSLFFGLTAHHKRYSCIAQLISIHKYLGGSSSQCTNEGNKDELLSRVYGCRDWSLLFFVLLLLFRLLENGVHYELHLID